MKGSLIIVGFFLLGTLCGMFHLLPSDLSQSNISFYALCALMFSVGISIGNDPQTLRNFRSLNPRLVLLPVATIFRYLVGSGTCQPHPTPPKCKRMHGDRLRYGLLLAIQHLHHPIQRSGAGYSCPPFQHSARNHDLTLCSPAGPLVRESGSYLCRRSNDDGYHPTHHYPHGRSAVCNRIHLPWFHNRFQCTVPRNVLLFVLNVNKRIHLQHKVYLKGFKTM